MKSKRDILCATRMGGVFLLQFFRQAAVLVMLTVVLISALCFFFSKNVYAETEGESETDEKLIVTKNIYHKHTGDSENGGGCYSNYQIYYHDVTVQCPGTLHYWGDDWGVSECTYCGASYTGDCGGQRCPHTSVETQSYVVYSLACGKSSAIVGTVTYCISPTEWAKSVDIDITYEDKGMKASKNPYIFNGNSYSEGHFTVEENGTYLLGISAGSNAATASAAYKAVISNIDKTGPVLQSYDKLPSDWTRDEVDVLIADVRDLQPDGSEGCGMDTQAFSYDGGNNWTELANSKYSENGIYTVMIRDKLGNIKEASVEVDNIDREAPNVISAEYDGTPNIKETELIVCCNDIMSDGREGSGLDEKAYSFDGGETWCAENSIHINRNGSVRFAVRDRLGNITHKDIMIDNIDDCEPEISYKMTPESWTNKNVKVTFCAKDRDGKGGDGVGLPPMCFSYDGGKNWTDNPCIEMKSNGKISVIVKDLNENYAYCEMEVGIIDRIPPEVSLAYEYREERAEIELVATSTDDLSGINPATACWSSEKGKSGGNNLIVTVTGKYVFQISDRAGNVTEKRLQIDDIPERKEKESDEEGPEEGPEVPPIVVDIADKTDEEPVPIVRTEDGEIICEALTEEESEEESVSEERVLADTPVYDEKIKESTNNQKNWWDSLTGLQKLIFVLLICILLLLLLLLLLLYIRSVVIINEKKRGEYLVLGVKLVKYRNGHYCLLIDENMWNNAESTHFIFKFSPVFALIHKGEEVYFYFPRDEVRVAEISGKIDVIL